MGDLQNGMSHHHPLDLSFLMIVDSRLCYFHQLAVHPDVHWIEVTPRAEGLVDSSREACEGIQCQVGYLLHNHLNPDAGPFHLVSRAGKQRFNTPRFCHSQASLRSRGILGTERFCPGGGECASLRLVCMVPSL